MYLKLSRMTKVRLLKKYWNQINFQVNECNQNYVCLWKLSRKVGLIPLEQCFPTFFGSQHPYLVLNRTAGTASWFIRYKGQGTKNYKLALLVATAHVIPVGNHWSAICLIPIFVCRKMDNANSDGIFQVLFLRKRNFLWFLDISSTFVLFHFSFQISGKYSKSRLI